MSEWKEIVLGDIVTRITKGTTPPKGQGFVNNGGVNYIKSDAIEYDGTVDQCKFVRINEEIHKKFKRSQLEEGDILFSMAGNYLGKSGIVTKEMLPANTNQALAIIRVNKEFALPQFIGYCFRQPNMIKYVNSMSAQSAQPNINFQEIASLYIRLPEIPEQKEIVDVLENLDQKITLLRQQNQDLEELAQTLFKRWFVEFEFPNENGEPYKSSGGKMVESELGEIPEGWRVEHLRTQITAIKGLSYKGAGLSDEGTVMHSLKSILEGGGYRHDGIKYYNAEYKERHIVRSGDIIVANTEQGEKHMLIGYPARIPNYSKGDSIFTHHLTKVERLPESSYTNEFIYYSLMCKQLRHQIISYTNGTTVNGLPADGLLEPVWIVPSKDILDSFAQVISANWHKQENNYEEIQTLTQLRDTLLPKLMSGELKIRG